MTRIRLIQGIVLVVAGLLTTAEGWAQTSGPGGRPGGGGGSSVTGHLPPPAPLAGPREGAPMSALAAAQYRLELLEEDLRILPQQRGAWLAYRERVLKLAEDTLRSARTVMGGDMPAPERLDKLADVARDRLTAVEDIVDAGKQLYAILTPGQKIIADRRMAVPVTALSGVEAAAGSTRGEPRTDVPKNP